MGILLAQHNPVPYPKELRKAVLRGPTRHVYRLYPTASTLLLLLILFHSHCSFSPLVLNPFHSCNRRHFRSRDLPFESFRWRLLCSLMASSAVSLSLPRIVRCNTSAKAASVSLLTSRAHGDVRVIETFLSFLLMNCSSGATHKASNDRVYGRSYGTSTNSVKLSRPCSLSATNSQVVDQVL